MIHPRDITPEPEARSTFYRILLYAWLSALCAIHIGILSGLALAGEALPGFRLFQILSGVTGLYVSISVTIGVFVVVAQALDDFK